MNKRKASRKPIVKKPDPWAKYTENDFDSVTAKDLINDQRLKYLGGKKKSGGAGK